MRAEERALRGVLEVQGDEEGGTPITSEWKKYSDLCIRHADLAYHFCMVRPGCCLAKFANTSFLTQFSDFLMVQPVLATSLNKFITFSATSFLP